MREAAIVSTARTAIGKAYRGAFNATEAPVLAGHVMNAVVERAGIDPARIDEVFWGVGNQWGTQGGNAGRMAIFAGGLPESVPAFTLDRKCGSGLTAVALAARTIMCDEADVALAGGMESISYTVTKDAPRFVNASVDREGAGGVYPDDRDRRDRRGEIRDQPRGAGRVCRDEPAACRRRAGERCVRRGDRADHGREGAVTTSRARMPGSRASPCRRTRVFARARRWRVCAG